MSWAVAADIMARSHAARPDSAESPNDEGVSEADLKAIQSVLAAGASPDEVGDMVLRAIIDNSAYIFTDRMMADAVGERTRAMVAAMPAEAEQGVADN